VAESDRALLEALGGNITKRPRTLSETVTEINKLTDEADRLAREGGVSHGSLPVFEGRTALYDPTFSIEQSEIKLRQVQRRWAPLFSRNLCSA
jgi:hypothetical protein